MTEQEIHNKHADSFADLQAQIDQLDIVLVEGAFISGNLQHVVVHALALRLIEFARGCRLVAGAGLPSAHATLGRQCLEVGFQLKSISRGTVSPEAYFAQALLKKSKELKKISESDELRSIFTAEQLNDFERQMQNLERELKEAELQVAPRKLKTITVEQWAAYAQETYSYATVYAVFSAHVHSGASSIGHIVDVCEKGQVLMQTGPSDYLLQDLLFGVNSCLASCAQDIQSMFAASSTPRDEE